MRSASSGRQKWKRGKMVGGRRMKDEKCLKWKTEMEVRKNGGRKQDEG